MAKYSSTKMVPNGNDPAAKKRANGCDAQCGGGICRGIWFVLVGNGRISLLDARAPPTNASGMEIKSHRKSTEKKNPRGMAPDDPVANKNRFKRDITATVTPGKKHAVLQHTLCHPSWLLFIAPQIHTEANPAATDINRYRIKAAVRRDPRDAGDKNPNVANIRVIVPDAMI